MIGVYLHGRLGNQMFQYAFAYSAARKLNVPFYFEEVINDFILDKYFELPEYNKYCNMVFKLLHRFIGRRNLEFHNSALPAENLKDLRNNTLYSGFFQSHEYFNEWCIELNKKLAIKKTFILEFRNKYGKIFNENKIIAVHIRRSDYEVHGNYELGGTDLRLPSQYYKNCFEKINDLNDCKVFFISDDMEFTRTHFNYMDNSYFEKNKMIIDFQILLNADVLVLANSSFSWWAAYLNDKKYKTIFAPRYWLGFKVKKEYPIHVVYPDWNSVECEDVK